MFDTVRLANWVMTLKEHGKFDKPFIDTLRFPTKSPSSELTKSLEYLFQEVEEAALILGIDLKETGGTFSVDYKRGKLYPPMVGQLDGVAVIKWGKKTYPLEQIIESSVYVKVQEHFLPGAFNLVFVRDGMQTVLPMSFNKGTTRSKSSVVSRLADGTLAGLLAPVKVYAEPMINLAKYMDGDEPLHLFVESLKLSEGGQYGTSGAIKFYELQDYYTANARCVGNIMERSSREGTPGVLHKWNNGQLRFTVKGIKTGLINGSFSKWLEYDILDMSVSVADFVYDDEDNDAQVKRTINMMEPLNRPLSTDERRLREWLQCNDIIPSPDYGMNEEEGNDEDSYEPADKTHEPLQIHSLTEDEVSPNEDVTTD